MPDMPDSFKLDSGLREDMVISIASAYFAPDAAYMQGQQLMLWLIGTDENDDPVDMRLSVGSDWQTDDGNVIVHPTKRQQRINKNTIYGFFLQFAFEIPELAKILIERSDQLDGKGPLDARIWLDLVIHVQNRTLHWGGQIEDQERLMPTEYMGMVTGATLPLVQESPPVAMQSPAPADLVAQARAQAQVPPPTTFNGSDLYKKAIRLAQSAPDFASFLGQAFQDADILADDELAEQVADQNLIWKAAGRT